MSSFTYSVQSSVVSNNTLASEKSERKKRDNINDGIQELLNVIPEEFFKEYYQKREDQELEDSTPGISVGGIGKNKGTGTRDGKPNKGQILTQAVEYLIYLQNQVDQRNRDEVELILKLKTLSKQTGTVVDNVNLENTEAEIALARIGVGPLAKVLDEVHNKSLKLDKKNIRLSENNNNFQYGGYR